MNLFDKALDLLTPDTCVLCRQTQFTRNPHLLCHFCWAALPRNTNGCPHCALPQANSGCCGRCLREPLTTGICMAPLKHEGDARLLIHQLKYARNLRAGYTLAHAMLNAIPLHYTDKPLPECLVPVPLSARRQFTRGFNQAAWLAARLTRPLQLPLDVRTVKRRHGPAQQELSRSARRNLAPDTFHLSRPISRQHVAIVDDVLTTGTTVEVLGSLLERQGVRRIDIWTATRTVLD